MVHLNKSSVLMLNRSILLSWKALRRGDQPDGVSLLHVTWFCDWSKELSVSAPGFSPPAEGLGLFAHSALSLWHLRHFNGTRAFLRSLKAVLENFTESEHEITPWKKGWGQGRCGRGSADIATLGGVDAQTLSPPFLVSVKPPNRPLLYSL